MPARVVGIIAGGGALPRELAESVRARGAAAHIVALDGEADEDFTGFPVTRCGWGKIGGMIRAFRRAGVTDVAFAGHVSRPDLWKLRPDLGFFLGLPEIAAIVLGGGGDDRVLRGVLRFFERRGFHVVGTANLAPQLIVGPGVLGRAQPTSQDESDIARAVAVLDALAPFDIGQGVVVREGRVEAIEAVENTDAMLRRLGEKRRAASGAPVRGGVLVKLTKRGQERRVDLPTIGKKTVVCAVEAGLSGIAVEAGGVIAVRRDDMLARADAADVFVAGIAKPAAGAGQLRPSAETAVTAGIAAWMAVAGPRPRDIALRDADRGAAVQRAAMAFGAGAAVVVSRGHVLALAADEAAAAVIGRVGTLRQWGARTKRHAAGTAVLARVADCTPDVVARAAASGLACIAIAESVPAGALPGDIARAAEAARISIISRSAPADRHEDAEARA